MLMGDLRGRKKICVVGLKLQYLLVVTHRPWEMTALLLNTFMHTQCAYLRDRMTGWR